MFDCLRNGGGVIRARQGCLLDCAFNSGSEGEREARETEGGREGGRERRERGYSS
jgi:hypothetical protein